MSLLRASVLLIALFMGGWLVFDGSRALVKGDYVTPRSGPSANQLGPWAKLVARLGINPRGTPMKAAHVIVGLAWLLGAATFLVRPGTGWYALVGAALCSVWYLPIGTVLSIVELVLLFLPAVRTLP